MDFRERVNMIKEAGAKTEAEIRAEYQAAEEARQKAEQTRFHAAVTETWSLANQVRRQLISKRIPFNGKMFPSPRKESSSGVSSFLDRTVGSQATKNAVGEWYMGSKLVRTSSTPYSGDYEINYDLYFGENGVIGATRGMTEAEHKRGIHVCEIVFNPGQAFEGHHDVNSIQNGLAFLAARHNLEI